MRITIELALDEVIALRRYASTHYPLELDEAAVLALREYLIATGDLELLPVLDADTETEGNA